MATSNGDSVTMKNKLLKILMMSALYTFLMNGAKAQHVGDHVAERSPEHQVSVLTQFVRELEYRNDYLQAQLEDAQRQLKEQRLIASGQVMREQLDDEPDVKLAYSLNDAALVMAAEERLQVAQVLFEKALMFLPHEPSRESLARGTLLQNLGEICLQQGNAARAITCFSEAASEISAVAGREHPRVAAALNAWAAALSELKRHDEAEQLYRRAIGIYEALPERYPLELAAPLYNLGVLLQETKHHLEGTAYLERALLILTRNRKERSVRTLPVLRALIRSAYVTGNPDLAVPYEKQAEAIALEQLERVSSE